MILSLHPTLLLEVDGGGDIPKVPQGGGTTVPEMAAL